MFGGKLQAARGEIHAPLGHRIEHVSADRVDLLGVLIDMRDHLAVRHDDSFACFVGAIAKSDEILECFGNLSRESFSKGKMADLLHQKQVTNKFTVAALLISDDVLDDLRKEIRRLSGIKVEVDYLRALLTNEIVKRDLIDSEEAKAAFQNVKRLQKRAAARKKSSENVLEEKPIVAPVEDASGYLPRAAVTEPVGKLNLS